MSGAEKSLPERIGSAAAEGAVGGLFLAYFFEGAPMHYVAAAFAAGAATVALRLALPGRDESAMPTANWLDEKTLPIAHLLDAPSPVPAVTPMHPDTAALMAKVADRLGLDEETFRAGLRANGPIAERKGGGWLVFDAPDAEPRLLNEREYQRFRRSTRDLVQVEPSWEGTKVTRLYLGRADSSLSGLPAIEVYDGRKSLVSCEWFVEGRRVSEDEAAEAHAALKADFAPRA